MDIDIQKGILQPAIEFIGVLNDQSTPGPEKLEKLTDKVDALIEGVDDIVELAPGIGPILKWVVDNPISDGWEREYMAKPAAEVSYQFWKSLEQGVDSLQDWAKQIVIPVRSLIAELSSNQVLSGAQKRAALTQRWVAVLDGITGAALPLTGGLRPLIELWLATQTAADLKRVITEFLAEISYQIFVFFFGTGAQPAPATA